MKFHFKWLSMIWQSFIITINLQNIQLLIHRSTNSFQFFLCCQYYFGWRKIIPKRNTVKFKNVKSNIWALILKPHIYFKTSRFQTSNDFKPHINSKPSKFFHWFQTSPWLKFLNESKTSYGFITSDWFNNLTLISKPHTGKAAFSNITETNTVSCGRSNV